MLNVIQLMDDRGLGHCKRMIVFAKELLGDQSTVLVLIIKDRQDQLKLLKDEQLQVLEYDPNSDFQNLYFSIEKTYPKQQIKSWSIDTKLNCSKFISYLKTKGVFTRLFDNSKACRLIVDENVYPTPLFNKEDLDWSGYEGNVLGGWDYALIGQNLKKIKENFDQYRQTSCVITFGGLDYHNITLKILKILLPIADQIPIVVILGPQYKHIESISNINKVVGNRIQIITGKNNIDNYIASAKLLITAIGLTVIESIFLGIPCVCVSNYKNDEIDEKKLKKMRDVYVLGNHRHLLNYSDRLIDIINNEFSLLKK